jgi:hypothetical protein
MLDALGIEDDPGCALIELGSFTRGRYRRAGFRRLRSWESADEAVDSLIAAGETTLGDQMLPDRHGVAAQLSQSSTSTYLN